MATNILRPKTHQEWLNLRSQGIGSSEVGTILCLNPFETPYQLWRRKKGLDPAIPENFAMRAGHYLEDAVARFYSDESGNQIIKRSATDWIVQNAEKPHLQVSPDRTFWLPDLPHNDHNKGILECKTTQLQVDADNLPAHWLCQIHYQLGVAELEEGALAWLTQGRDFGYQRIEFDPEFFAYIVEEVDRFWTDCIIGNQEPLSINVEDVMLRNPRHTAGKTVEADEQLMQDCDELKRIKEQLAELDTRKKKIEGDIKLAIGDAESLVYKGADGKQQVIATWKSAKDAMKFDEKRFAAENPDVYARYQYCAPGSRRFLLK